jgi:hypothetical protein
LESLFLSYPCSGGNGRGKEEKNARELEGERRRTLSGLSTSSGFCGRERVFGDCSIVECWDKLFVKGGKIYISGNYQNYQKFTYTWLIS